MHSVVRVHQIETIIVAIEEAAKEVGVHDVWRRARSGVLLRWRYQGMRLAVENRYSAASIGRAIGYDHTTVLNGLLRWKEAMQLGDPAQTEIDRRARAYLAEFDQNKVEKLCGDLIFSGRCIVERRAEKRRGEWLGSRAATKEQGEMRKIEDARIAVAVMQEHSRLKTDIHRLRKIGWSVDGLARRYGIGVSEVEEVLGVQIYERDNVWF